METVKTIKPGGGGDYTTLAYWWSARKTSGNADEWAECYSGGDLGIVDLSGMTATPDAAHYPKIYAKPGQQHDGISGGAIIEGVASSAGINVQVPYTRVEGLNYQGVADSDEAVSVVGVSHVVVDGMLAVDADSAFGALASSGAAVSDVRFRNCIARSSHYAFGVNAIVATGSASCSAEFDNCTGTASADADANVFSPYAWAAATGTTATANMTCRNCVGMGATGGDYAELTEGDPGTENSVLSCDHCASEDGTAANFGGTGNLFSQDPDDLFKDPANGDLRLIADSALNFAGANLIGYFTKDIVGMPRPIAGRPWDIGAFAYVCAAYFRLDEATGSQGARPEATDQVQGYNLVAADDNNSNYPYSTGSGTGNAVIGSGRAYRGTTVSGFTRGGIVGPPEAEKCFHLGSGCTAFGWFKVVAPGQSPTTHLNNWTCAIISATNWGITAIGDNAVNGTRIDRFTLSVDSEMITVYCDNSKGGRGFYHPFVEQGDWTFLAAWIDPPSNQMGFQVNAVPYTITLNSTPTPYDPNDCQISLLSTRTADDNSYTNAADEWGFVDRPLGSAQLNYIYNSGQGRRIF